jgi:Arc/MetJ-type ribon-helix-helix transcriptional regulator
LTAAVDDGHDRASMSETTVLVVINQQQAQMLDRLIAEGKHGSSYGEVIRSGFLEFCRQHLELADSTSQDRGNGGSDG